MLLRHPPATRIADRLAAAARARFVGREAELALFRSAILASEPPFAVLHIHGPGGIGKTTLVREFARIAREAGKRTISLDARNLEPTPDAFLACVTRAFDIADPANAVVIIDTCETLAPLDSWLREVLLPQLPAQTLIVFAGREAPQTSWSTDVDWAPLTRIVALRNLGPEESRSYLTLREVPPARQQEVLSATFGHPLALSLAADSLARVCDSASFDLANNPDIVRVLLEKFVQDMPSAQHRLALYACAFAATTTEGLLSAALALDDARELFGWLGQLSFVEHGPHGLFPHDLAREVLCADSRWRNPELRRVLNERLLGCLYGAFQRAHGVEQQRIWFDIIYLQRYNRALRPFMAWGAVRSTFATPLRPQDAQPILEMVKRHEGAASAQIARYWLLRQPRAFLSFRDPAGEVMGFMAHVRIEHATEEDRRTDPAVHAALAFVADRAPARRGEGIVYLRFWMTREVYQQPSPAMSVLAANCSLYWTTHPELAWNLMTSSDPGSVEPALASLNVWRAQQADFEVGGRKYGVFAHDWRVEPIGAWLRAKVDRATNIDAAGDAAAAPSLLVLSQADFMEAVRQALRDYTRPDRLATNPLLRTRLLADEADERTKVVRLRALIDQATSALAQHPKDQKLQRALWHTFLQPAPTHEAAAELLGLPFNTYRYQLGRAIERLTDWLWNCELRGAAPLPGDDLRQ